MRVHGLDISLTQGISHDLKIVDTVKSTFFVPYGAYWSGNTTRITPPRAQRCLVCAPTALRPHQHLRHILPHQHRPATSDSHFTHFAPQFSSRMGRRYRYYYRIIYYGSVVSCTTRLAPLLFTYIILLQSKLEYAEKPASE